MDDPAPHYNLNHRKRKPDNDDPNDHNPSTTSASVVPSDADPTPSIPPGPSHAPRQPWLASESDDALWSSPTSPQVSSPLSSQVALHDYHPQPHPSKRPRLEKLDLPPVRRLSRRSPSKIAPVKSVRRGSDIEDIGIVPTVEPGPSTGSLLRVRTASFYTKTNDRSSTRSIPFDLNSLPIPPLQPLINRQTLKELDLDAILRNPQLRHDLLFDPGLQFRPTGSRRKRDMSEKYWAAVGQEIETGCTCISFDLRGKSHPLVCVCSQATLSSSNPVVYQPTPDVYTLRMPSRIQPLLAEFLEVLLLVIQPLSSISGIYVNPNTFKAQMQEHSAQAAYIRSIFDPILIEQEVKHNIFDPSGLFTSIGATLKGHCAPMRDRSVEAMVRTAQMSSSGAIKSSKIAIKALKMCMEILELMKLDIANHQLQTLRPFLIRTAGQFELKTLKSRYGSDCSLRVTREWIDTAHDAMLNVPPISHPFYPRGDLHYKTLQSNQQLYISVLKGIVDLVFNPPSGPLHLLSPLNTPATSPISPSTSTPFPLFPETLYLDNARILLMGSDAADATALYMLILLYRQLLHSDNSDSSTSPRPKIQDTDISRLKRELRDIAGSSRLGACFSRSIDVSRSDSRNREVEKWRVVKQDVVLQVAKRATDMRLQGPATCPSSTTSSLSDSFSPSTPPSSPVGEGPDERTLSLAQRWADTNMQPGSVLSAMLHNRLRDTVFNAVLVSTYPGRDLTTGSRPVNFPVNSSNIAGSAVGAVTGMEPLGDEIRSLTEKISLLALVHLNAYLPMYEKEGFSPSQ